MLLGAVVALTLVALVLVMATDRRRLAFTLGVQTTQVAASVKPGSEACQSPIDVSADADSVRFQVGTYRRPGQPLIVTARAPAGDLVYGRGQVPAGYADNSNQATAVRGLERDRRIAVCIRNVGRHSVALYGGGPQAARNSELLIDGKGVGTDLTVLFDRDRPRSMLSLFPQVFQRAAVFQAQWVGPAIFWVLAGALALLAPFLLALALATSGSNERD